MCCVCVSVVQIDRYHHAHATRQHNEGRPDRRPCRKDDGASAPPIAHEQHTYLSLRMLLSWATRSSVLPSLLRRKKKARRKCKAKTKHVVRAAMPIASCARLRRVKWSGGSEGYVCVRGEGASGGEMYVGGCADGRIWKGSGQARGAV